MPLEPSICDPDGRWAVLGKVGFLSVDLLDALHLDPVDRPPGEAVPVFPTGEFDPNGFLRFLSLVRKLPQRPLLVRPRVDLLAHVAAAQRAHASKLGPGLDLLGIHFGYDGEQNVPDPIALLSGLDASRLRYYVIDDRMLRVPLRGIARWRAVLFPVAFAASVPPAQWFHVPPERTTTVAMGASPQHSLAALAGELASELAARQGST